MTLQSEAEAAISKSPLTINERTARIGWDGTALLVKRAVLVDTEVAFRLWQPDGTPEVNYCQCVLHRLLFNL
jgi:hypothetical protein